MTTIEEIKTALETYAPTGLTADFDKGVKQYALDVLGDCESIKNQPFTDWAALKDALMNGADSFRTYANGSCRICYNIDILERLAPEKIPDYKAGKMDGYDFIGLQEFGVFNAFCLIKEYSGLA